MPQSFPSPGASRLLIQLATVSRVEIGDLAAMYSFTIPRGQGRTEHEHCHRKDDFQSHRVQALEVIYCRPTDTELW